MTMTVVPVIVLVIAVICYKKKYILTDEKVEELAKQVGEMHKE